ncbi:MAG TPA: DUF4338 domain-containing protein [Candidatus Binatia bacterium]|nr:DUF4338 domain-containing protein [Candidatus Binatia bacterium]
MEQQKSMPGQMPQIDCSGRRFSSTDLDLILEVTNDFSMLSLTELSKTLCELLEWKRPNGKLKYEECRALLEKLQADGQISLPALRKIKHSPRQIQESHEGNPQPAITGSIGQYEPLSLRPVQACDGRLHSLFNQFIQRYHYLGYRVPFGAHLRYLVESRTGSHLACLLFSSPAWKMAPRDAWIDWSDGQRRRNLQYVVSNSRFLILPWVSVHNLASKILSLVTRQLPLDWQSLYGYRPLLLETLVDGARFGGTCYRAANWIYLGKTQGRGRMDRDHTGHGRAVKDIYIYPLCRNARRRLCQDSAPEFREVPDPETY